MSNAIDAGVPVVVDAPRSKSAQSIVELAEYIVELRERVSPADSLATVEN